MAYNMMGPKNIELENNKTKNGTFMGRCKCLVTENV